MSAKGYTDLTALQNYGLVDVDGAFASQIDEWIEAAEGIIDLETGRNFKADTAATARFFDGNGETELIIDDAIEITTVEVGTDGYGGAFETIANSGSNRYFTDPANHVALKIPVTKLTLAARRFYAGKQNVRVTAKWGYSAAVPKDIKMAATVFTFGIMNQNRQGGNEIKSERIGNYTVTYNSEAGKNSWADFENAMDILTKYKRYYL